MNVEETRTTLTRPLVLFADDDGVARAIARQVVSMAGFSILLAENGEEALQLIREHKPELVITDALMPKLDGRELGRHVKEANLAAKVVVITSVYRDPRYKYEAYKQFEVDEYVLKPVTPGKVQDIVDRYLRREQA